jgi:hypothetical protein
MLHNTSRNPDEARSFFIKYADRIIFGTDSMGDYAIGQAKSRARMVSRWLASGDEFGVDPEADPLLGQSDEGKIRGMSLPEDVLAKIYASNIERLVGREPKPQDRALAMDECRRLASELEQLKKNPELALGCLQRLQARG